MQIWNASDGKDVGAFQANLKIGADIQIGTPLAGLAVFYRNTVTGACTPLTINWSGGDPNSWVSFSLVQTGVGGYGGFAYAQWNARTRTSNGTLTLLRPVPPALACGEPPPFPITIAIEVDPDPSEITAFSASGLSVGSRATWKYIHTFSVGLELQ